MVWWLLALICAVLLFFAAPTLLGAILLVAFAVASVGNAHCVWISVRRTEHHSTVPLVGAPSGALGLSIISGAIERSAPRLWKAWYLALPFILDVGTLKQIGTARTALRPCGDTRKLGTGFRSIKRHCRTEVIVAD